MNMPLMPNVVIENDKNRIMARSGDLVGLSRTRAIWRFGFLPDSDASKAYNVNVPAFHWIIAKHNGEVLDSFEGFAIELPKRYTDILHIKLW